VTRIATHSHLNGDSSVSRRRLRWLQAVFLLGGILAVYGVARHQTETPATNVTVQRVIDGDTLVLADGRHVRLIGVDTPERGDCGYQEATQALERLAGPGTSIRLDLGQDPTDRYGRTLAYLTVAGRDVATQMAAEGWGVRMMIAPNGRNAHQIQEAETDASRRHLGIWGLCDPEPGTTA
jgi:micrococcal nuclease